MARMSGTRDTYFPRFSFTRSRADHVQTQQLFYTCTMKWINFYHFQEFCGTVIIYQKSAVPSRFRMITRFSARSAKFTFGSSWKDAYWRVGRGAYFLLNIYIWMNLFSPLRTVLQLLLPREWRIPREGSLDCELLSWERLQRHHGPNGVRRNYFPGPHAVGRESNKKGEKGVDILVSRFGKPRHG